MGGSGSTNWDGKEGEKNFKENWHKIGEGRIHLEGYDMTYIVHVCTYIATMHLLEQ